MTTPTTPRTASGRRVARNLRSLNLPPDPDSDWPESDILAIEAESFAAGRAASLEDVAERVRDMAFYDADGALVLDRAAVLALFSDKETTAPRGPDGEPWEEPDPLSAEYP